MLDLFAMNTRNVSIYIYVIKNKLRHVRSTERKEKTHGAGGSSHLPLENFNTNAGISSPPGGIDCDLEK